MTELRRGQTGSRAINELVTGAAAAATASAIVDNTISDANWRRISLGSAY